MALLVSFVLAIDVCENGTDLTISAALKKRPENGQQGTAAQASENRVSSAEGKSGDVEITRPVH
jgi:hypothetical protein